MKGVKRTMYEVANENYKAILELDKILTEKGIPHELSRLYDGWMIAYPNNIDCIFDVIEHGISYGHQNDLMEAWGKGIHDVEGWLDVETALAHFERVHQEEGAK